MYACIQCVLVCVFLSTLICIYVFICVCFCAFVCPVHVYACMHVHVYVYVCVFVYVCARHGTRHVRLHRTCSITKNITKKSTQSSNTRNRLKWVKFDVLLEKSYQEKYVRDLYEILGICSCHIGLWDRAKKLEIDSTKS